MTDQALVDQLLAIVRRRDEHRAYAAAGVGDDQVKLAYERHIADQMMEAKFREFVALVRDLRSAE